MRPKSIQKAQTNAETITKSETEAAEIIDGTIAEILGKKTY